jgi:exopolyphosphatase/guanosine-5'-triphosphate,3'-diphosphate pyrophosphatase
MAATYSALVEYKKQLTLESFDIEKVLVTATEAARVAGNSTEFFKKIKKELGFNITIITAEAEAYFTAMGVASGSDSSDDVVIMDIGGASTELIKAQLNPFKIIDSISLPIGSVRAMDWERDGLYDSKMLEIDSNDFAPYQTNNLICVAGGMTAMAAMYLGLKEFDPLKIDGMNISFTSFTSFAEDLQKTNVQNLLLLFPFLGKRASVVSAASKIAIFFGKQLAINNVLISTRGLRYGTVLIGEINENFTSR